MNPDLPIVVDSTMLSCLKQCQQKFKAEFLLGLRPPGISIDLHAGGCFALALEKVYENYFFHSLSLEESLSKAHAIFMEEWGDVTPPEHNQTKKAKNKDRVWEAVEDYFTKYHPKTDHIQPLILNDRPTLEFTFAIPLDIEGFPKHPSGDPFVYAGRFDMLGDYLGMPIVKDDKTTGSIGRNWAEQWDLRSQFIGYTWAARQSGIKVNQVIARGVGIQMTQFVHAEAIKTYPDYLIDRWLDLVRRQLIKMVRAWEEGYFEYNFDSACTQYGNCIFIDRCRAPDPDAWNSIYVVRHWNPLQKDPTKEKEAA